MANASLGRRLGAELIGSALLLATVIGSGIMGERLSGGNVALALLGNTLPTGAILVVLITMLGPISGAHFNPAVTAVFALRKEIPPAEALGYIGVQVLGAVLGVMAAHLMFEESRAADFGQGACWPGTMVCRVGGGVRPRAHDLADAASQQLGRADVRRALHHRGLLVHRLDVLCQPGRDGRSRALRHVCGHSARWMCPPSCWPSWSAPSRRWPSAAGCWRSAPKPRAQQRRASE